MEIKNYRAINKGSLNGYLDIYLPKLDWTLHGCGYFVSNGKRWISLPSRPYKDEAGKQCYADIISMPKEVKSKFSEMALVAYDAFKPPQAKEVDANSAFTEECPF
jgi:hypothetical protein